MIIKNCRNKILYDKKLRNLFLNTYWKFYIIKNIFHSLKYNIEIDLILYLYLNCYYNLSYKYLFITYFKDFGFLNGRSRFILTKYGVSRLEFKTLILKNKISSIYISSW